MSEPDYQELVEEVIEENRYLALATTDGPEPWVATIEYVYDEGTFYFFSTVSSRHVRHIEENGTVAVAIWSRDQPEYSPTVSTTLNGVQFRGEARQLAAEEYPDPVATAVKALEPPMPPYAGFELVPHRVYAPVIQEGVNRRVEVEL